MSVPTGILVGAWGSRYRIDACSERGIGREGRWKVNAPALHRMPDVQEGKN